MPIPVPLPLAFTLPSDTQTYALVAAVIATGYVFMKARKGMPRDPFKGEAPYSKLSTQRRVENQMNDLLVELEKMSRQLSAQLDTRSAKLEELIRQADERLARLDDRITEFKEFENGSFVMRQDDTRPASPPQAPPHSMYAPPPPMRDDPPPSIPIDPRHAAVYRLADEGRSSTEIAREIGQPAGEVELILALRRRVR